MLERGFICTDGFTARLQANHLILADPWWNPAAEEQAIDRWILAASKDNRPNNRFQNRFQNVDTLQLHSVRTK